MINDPTSKIPDLLIYLKDNSVMLPKFKIKWIFGGILTEVAVVNGEFAGRVTYKNDTIEFKNNIIFNFGYAIDDLNGLDMTVSNIIGYLNEIFLDFSLDVIQAEPIYKFMRLGAAFTRDHNCNPY